MLMRYLLPVAIALASSAATAALPKCPRTDPAPPMAAPCRQFYLDRRAPASPPSAGASEPIFCHSFYALSYSPARRNPVWTSYRLTGEMSEQSDRFGRRGYTFARQEGLASSQQPRDGNWTNTGFARGHMTPDNDAPTCATQADTYWVTNIVPQVPGFNSGLWAGLEGALHDLAIGEGEIFIVTGPIFGAPRRRMGTIEVPSHLFKAIYVPSRGFALAFIASNENPTRCRIVPLADLELQAGIDVFPSLPDSLKAELPAMPAGWGGFPSRCRAT
ncbi:MAG TPA: DNA/RNA non-specific endonuclease [Allosphingosinicella sp.]|nr:DNA/RNA non-specific endonuclease [Allosphingosinicella sp.]